MKVKGQSPSQLDDDFRTDSVLLREIWYSREFLLKHDQLLINFSTIKTLRLKHLHGLKKKKTLNKPGQVKKLITNNSVPGLADFFHTSKLCIIILSGLDFPVKVFHCTMLAG